MESQAMESQAMESHSYHAMNHPIRHPLHIATAGLFLVLSIVTISIPTTKRSNYTTNTTSRTTSRTTSHTTSQSERSAAEIAPVITPVIAPVRSYQGRTSVSPASMMYLAAEIGNKVR